ncbi:MAG: prepilin-type N-terminal cleavage/methylation domain-containing protein [Kiritimatiellae bacterium]|nr:prepilin-type N-terminal cleavage/methylation domain-containing protein [Kiritimatiellia bacterium]
MRFNSNVKNAPRNGFSLLELVVVLAVLSVLTHLAVRELGAMHEGKLVQAADRQLDAIREASAAFLSDVGRLPRLTAETNRAGEVTYTLAELWKKPASLDNRTLVERDGATLAVGWNGPYLRLPVGRGRLRDPWGNPIEREDAAGLPRLLASVDSIVTNVCHYGPKGQPGERRTVSLLPEAGLSARLSLTVDAGDYDGELVCRWLGPFENTVTGGTATVLSGAQVTFDGLTPGTKAVVVSKSAPAAGGIARRIVRLVEVAPGVNQVQVKIP